MVQSGCALLPLSATFPLTSISPPCSPDCRGGPCTRGRCGRLQVSQGRSCSPPVPTGPASSTSQRRTKTRRTLRRRVVSTRERDGEEGKLMSDRYAGLQLGGPQAGGIAEGKNEAHLPRYAGLSVPLGLFYMSDMILMLRQRHRWTQECSMLCYHTSQTSTAIHTVGRTHMVGRRRRRWRRREKLVKI